MCFMVWRWCCLPSCLPASLPVCLPSFLHIGCLSAYIPVYLPSSCLANLLALHPSFILPVCLPILHPACLSTYVPYLPTLHPGCLPTSLPACLSNFGIIMSVSCILALWVTLPRYSSTPPALPHYYTSTQALWPAYVYMYIHVCMSLCLCVFMCDRECNVLSHGLYSAYFLRCCMSQLMFLYTRMYICTVCIYMHESLCMYT